MAIKDAGSSENIEHNKPVDGSQSAVTKPTEKSESSQIKNAHAVGDGSYGRNDESLPDESDAENSNEPQTGESAY